MAQTTSQPQDRLARYRHVRALTEQLAEPLSPEDQQVQSMPDVSPTKWHRAHTTWFFETFLLTPNLDGYKPFHSDFLFLYNSYYEAVGERHERKNRGLITRPSADEVSKYRAHVDSAMEQLIQNTEKDEPRTDLTGLIELGLNHEQQHQELLLMDIKHVLSSNPMKPPYLLNTEHENGATNVATQTTETSSEPQNPGWVEFEGGIAAIGCDASKQPVRSDLFHFDNEEPAHEVLLEPYKLASQLVTCGEWLDFIADGGYKRPELWLSEGWSTVKDSAWDSPLYWQTQSTAKELFTLHGNQPLNRQEPVCHISYFEADAFARWAGSRLPTEFEWENAALKSQKSQEPVASQHFRYHPQGVQDGQDPQVTLAQLYSDVWQWTSTSYGPYPRFKASPGAVGEYNGKFMVNQYVLRGASCATPAGHSRATYRNFFPAQSRWLFSGLRLADYI